MPAPTRTPAVLWDGTYAFTVLTGVLGGGEEGQPRHPDGVAFARLLLEAGANPNDTQAIYNGTFLPDNAHLELLFEFGLGTGDPGPWAARLGPRAASVADYLHLNLEWAAQHGFVDRVRLLLDHGVDPNGRSHYRAEDGRSPYELAEVAGNRETPSSFSQRAPNREGSIPSSGSSPPACGPTGPRSRPLGPTSWSACPSNAMHPSHRRPRSGATTRSASCSTSASTSMPPVVTPV